MAERGPPLWLALLQLLWALGERAAAEGPQNPLAGSQYQQHNNILHFVVPEGAPNQTYLGNIRSADGQPPYLVLPAPQTPESERVAALSINLLNGDLLTNSVLDREFREQYHFVAIVKEPFAEIKCTVTVKDVNDNAPIFLLPSNNETNFVIEMPEGQRGVRKMLPLAVDFDTAQFGIKEFRIVSGNTPSGTFQLVEHEAPARSTLQQQQQNGLLDDSSSSILAGDNPQLMQQLAQQATVLIPSQPILQQQASSQLPQNLASATTSTAASSSQSKFLIDLEVNQTLDRENQSSYQLVVEAIDGGQPPLLGRLMVTVVVQDVNDNDPVFSRKLYECHFREETAKGTLLLRVQAFDADLDSNGQISYFLKRHTSSSQATSINSNSSDNNEALATVMGSRYINPNNNNNNINSNNKHRPLTTQAATLSSGNKLAQRQQQGSNEIFDPASAIVDSANSFSKNKMAAGTPEPMFEIDPVKGEIYLAHQLDYETDQMHELLIEARDHGKPSRSGYAIVKVFVIDVNDDPPQSTINRSIDDKRSPVQVPSSEASRSELSANRIGADLAEVSQNYFQNFNLNWFAQINSSLLFVIVLVVLFAVAFPVCLVKIKSHQPESDYNDTAGLTLTPNNGQVKQSPNHSTSNELSNSSNENQHRHHDHQRRANNSFGGLNGSGFGSSNGKLRYQYIDSSNLYHNPYPQQQSRLAVGNRLDQSDSPPNHQMASGGGSAGGTMTLLNHHALIGSPGGNHSLEHHQFSVAGNAAPHHSSSLTYAHHHSRAALLHQAHHHQSSHHLSSVHHVGHNKGGTMNSVGTHHSAHPSASPLPATPNTTHSSGLPPNLHDGHNHGHSHHNPLLPMPPMHSTSAQQPQLPPTPCNAPANMFTWPHGPGSTIGFMGASNSIHGPNGPTMDCAPSSQPFDRWFDLGVSSQLVYANDWYGSYNWDYLSDWAPEYHTLMPLIQAEACGY